MTVENAIIHKDKVVIAPEAKDKKGMIYAMNPNPYPEAWIADVEIRVGNSDKSTKPSSVVGIYYVRDVDTSLHSDSIEGYNRKFNGIALYLNTHYQKNTKRSVA